MLALFAFAVAAAVMLVGGAHGEATTDQKALFTVEGKALLRGDMHPTENWRVRSRVLLDYGKHIGFLREDGSFVVEGVPSGSYIVEVANSDYIFEPLRVDITSKGKIRARKLNLLQPNVVSTLPYPLQMTARQPTKYFRAREEYRITDMLMNPMVLMLLVAFFLMVIMPKLTSADPELQKEMQNVQMPKMDMPDMADMFASFFGGGGGGGKKGGQKKTPAVGGPSTSSSSKRQRN